MVLNKNGTKASGINKRNNGFEKYILNFYQVNIGRFYGKFFFT